MKNEFYEYACPRNRITDNNKSERTSKKDNYVLIVCSLTILLPMSLPMIIKNTLIWGIIALFSVLVLLFNRKDKDPYSHFILLVGLGFVYFSVVTTYALVGTANISNAWSTVFILSAIGVLFYEISVLINVMMKKYTRRGLTTYIAPVTISSLPILASYILGRLFSRTFREYPWMDYIMALACALVFVIAFSFLQKYILYKIFRYKDLKSKF